MQKQNEKVGFQVLIKLFSSLQSGPAVLQKESRRLGIDYCYQREAARRMCVGETSEHHAEAAAAALSSYIEGAAAAAA